MDNSSGMRLNFRMHHLPAGGQDETAIWLEALENASKTWESSESSSNIDDDESIESLTIKARYRRVKKTPTSDHRLDHLKSILVMKPPQRFLRDTETLQIAARKFLIKAATFPDANCYPEIEEFSEALEKCKSEISYPIMNQRHLSSDIEHCSVKNKAFFQRIIMMHVINSYWLDSIFAWNCEGNWSLPKDNYLPSRADDRHFLPKPDMAASFAIQSFMKNADDSVPIPDKLEQCISPDEVDQYFPFLFMEVAKADNLQEVHMKNLLTSSQALYNIWLWMIRAGLKERFFEEVRVFSFVFDI